MEITLAALWLPILLSSVAIFFASFVLWTISPHHKPDWKGLPNEDGVMDVLRDQGASQPGQYVFPYCASNDDMKSEAYQKKYADGPSGMLVIRPKGGWNMGSSLVQSLVYNIFLVAVAAYLATIGLTKATPTGDVFRFISTTVWLGCAGALGWGAIWWARSWSSIAKEAFDGLIYGLLSGGIFLWMWPS